MGTTFRIVAYARDGAEAQSAAQAAFRTVARLDSLFSDYSSDSEISHLAEGAGSPDWTKVSPELWAVLVAARRWSDLSGGAFDVTVGPLTRLWRWSSRRGELPDTGRLREARAAVDFRHLEMDSVSEAIRLSRSGMSLDLGGIAKGFAADAALGVLAEHGIHAALVDAGGDLALGDAPPNEIGWLVALPDGDSLRLANAAVATSGDAYRYVEIDGIRYSHVVDPRTGLGVIDAPTVTAIASSATFADALASALTVMDAEAGAALVRSLEGATARTSGRGGWTSDSFPGRASSGYPRRDRP
jgi:thiamine biosynthesis lipoprotein